MGDAGSAGDGAGGGRVEVIVEGWEVGRVPVGGEDVGDCGAGEGGDGEVEEVVEGGDA